MLDFIFNLFKKKHQQNIFVVTSKEAAVLASFDEDHRALLPELAVSALLTPSEVRNIVASLRSKQLIGEDDSDDWVVRLTPLGGSAQQAIKRHQRNVIIYG